MTRLFVDKGRSPTFYQIKKATARMQANDDASADLQEAAPAKGRNLFDAIVKASTSPEPVKMAAQASLLNHLIGRDR